MLKKSIFLFLFLFSSLLFINPLAANGKSDIKIETLHYREGDVIYKKTKKFTEVTNIPYGFKVKIPTSFRSSYKSELQPRLAFQYLDKKDFSTLILSISENYMLKIENPENIELAFYKQFLAENKGSNIKGIKIEKTTIASLPAYKIEAICKTAKKGVLYARSSYLFKSKGKFITSEVLNTNADLPTTIKAHSEILKTLELIK